jgi:hypothetical protein
MQNSTNTCFSLEAQLHANTVCSNPTLMDSTEAVVAAAVTLATVAVAVVASVAVAVLAVLTLKAVISNTHHMTALAVVHAVCAYL